LIKPPSRFSKLRRLQFVEDFQANRAADGFIVGAKDLRHAALAGAADDVEALGKIDAGQLFLARRRSYGRRGQRTSRIDWKRNHGGTPS